MSHHTRACCSSPSSIFFWFLASLLAWAALSLIGMYWHPLGPASASTIMLAAGIGCVANWLRNRTFHCGVTAPLFLVVGILFLLSDIRTIHINPRIVWPIVWVGIGVGFFLEWRYARRGT